MAFDPAAGYAAGIHDDTSLPIFDVQRVQLRFDISAEFVAAQVANNVLVLALSTGRILRFDLDNSEDIDDIDLPKKPAEVGLIRKLFLDPSASHLIISTTLGENYYLHMQSRTPKALARLKGVQIESIGWSPSVPTASTREILVGAADGSVYETYIEPSTEFYRREERYVKTVYSTQGGPVSGLHVDVLSDRPDTRRVLVATQNELIHFAGRSGKTSGEGSGSIYSKLFESEMPTVHESESGSASGLASLSISPEAQGGAIAPTDPSGAAVFAWLSSAGIYHGSLLKSASDPSTLGRQVFKASKLLPQSKLPPVQTYGGRNRATQPPLESVILTQFHILALIEGRLTAINRLDNSIVYNEAVLDSGAKNLGLFTDHEKNTHWLFTPTEILEIVVTDESRDVWQIYLKQGQFETAQRYAQTVQQKDTVAGLTGDHLIAQGKFDEAAVVLGQSTKPIEDVALQLIDKGENDALRKYLNVRLSHIKKSYTMQRVLLASWLVELYVAKLNQLDDTISTKADLSVDSSNTTAAQSKDLLSTLRKEFRDFCVKYKADLDRDTVYGVISGHGREEELLFYANVVGDYNYVLSYWVHRERWQDAMDVLKKQSDPEMFYKYSTVLMSHTPIDLVEVLMRQGDLEPKQIIPALLTYNKTIGSNEPLAQNQAIRYLLFCINHSHSTDAAVHNTLISLYASHPSKDETALLSYLETQASSNDQFYDADFALRLCIAHGLVQSCVHIYCTMSQYASAVDLALRHNETDLAARVANSPTNDDALRKKLWLKVAKSVIGREKGIKSAISILKRSGTRTSQDGSDPTTTLLRIEDLIPFFPDFVIIDDFKTEICAALESYSLRIDALKTEMDDAALTASRIQTEISSLDSRYAIVEPGERCWKCRLPLLMRQFFVFPCQHAFHADCLGDMVGKRAGATKARRIRECQREIARGVGGKRREVLVRELDGLVGGACVLCSDMAIKLIDEPFVTKADNEDEWAV